MEVLLVRAAVPFPCPRRTQKSGELVEPRVQSKFLTAAEAKVNPNPTKSSTVAASASNRSGSDPQTSPFGTMVPLPTFPLLKFPWFKAGGKKEGGGDGGTTTTVRGDVASLALSASHDGTTLPLSDEEKRTVHEVLSTLQSSELTALEVATITPLHASDDDVDIVGSEEEELAKAEAEIAKSWLHNFLRIRSLWNIRQFNANTKSPAKQSGAAVVDADQLVETTSPEEGRDSSSVSVVGESVGCVCEECAVDTDEDDAIAPVAVEAKEIAHIKITHSRESFSKFLHPVPTAELKTVSHLSFLSNLAYAIPTIKPGDLSRYHRLRFVTSSVHARAREKKAAMEKAAQDEAAAKESARIEELENSLAASEASSSVEEVDAEKQSSRRFSFIMRKPAKVPPRIEPTAYQIETVTSREVPSVDRDTKLSVQVDQLQNSELGATPSPADNIPVGDDNPADVQPSHSCPCEWFICDDDLSKTRNISIQGSDSVASWQTNLLFEPTRFEDPKLGVMVHRGIYEAATALYEDLLPHVLEHVQRHGSEARIRFTGHSLGGSLAILLSLMLRVRDAAPLRSLLPVYTFGSPFVLCGGDHLLQHLGFPQNHVQMVVMHRDIVPRSFTCTYPDHIAEVLKRVNGTFRDYSCLKKQSLLYAPMGVMRVIQPPVTQAPGHPFLPVGSGIYDVLHPASSTKPDMMVPYEQSIELRAAQRAFLNNPHPLEILRDRGSYGSGGGISRDHDPRSYSRAVNYVLNQELRKARRTQKTARRVPLMWPSLATESGVEFIKGMVLNLGMADSESSVNSSGEDGSLGAASSGIGATHPVLRRAGRLERDGRSTSSSSVVKATIVTTSRSTMDRLTRYSRLIASKHVHIGMLLLVSVRVLLMQGLATFVA